MTSLYGVELPQELFLPVDYLAVDYRSTVLAVELLFLYSRPLTAPHQDELQVRVPIHGAKQTTPSKAHTAVVSPCKTQHNVPDPSGMIYRPDYLQVKPS